MLKQEKILILVNHFRIDFNLLALAYPPLASHLVILDYQATINFKNQQSLILLATAILITIFKIKVWYCSKKNLCPRIPSRLNYILWIQYCLKQFNTQINTVVDIGTGSTLIYPLIGTSLFNWNFIGTESDQQSYNQAQSLIRQNKLQGRIKLIKVHENNILIDVLPSNIIADVLICNPPFFELDTENQYANSISEMKISQHSIEGGQYQFFFNIYNESHRYPNIEYFTMLVGRKKDFQQIKKFLENQKNQMIIEKVFFGKIEQGSGPGKVRGIVAWKLKL